MSGGVSVDLPGIAERQRRDVLRDPEPGSSTGAAVLDYQAIAVRQVGALPPDLLEAPSPDFTPVRLDDGERKPWLRTIPGTSV